MKAILLHRVSSPALRVRGGHNWFVSPFPEISGKRLELLKEIVPRLSRVAVIGTSTNPGNAQALRETELAAGAFRVQLQYLDVLGPKILGLDSESQARGVLRECVNLSNMTPVPFCLSITAPSLMRTACRCQRMSLSVPIFSIMLLGTIHAQRLFDCSDVEAMN
jgi:hypothetical protein